jgi:hypothetical protein
MQRPPPFPDRVIAGYLDDTWRSPSAVQRLMRGHGGAVSIADALARLSLAGTIEESAKATTVPKFQHKQSVLSIHRYRKRQT